VVVELAEHARRLERVERGFRQRICAGRSHVDQRRGRSEDRSFLSFHPDVHLDGKCSRDDEQRSDECRHDDDESVRHESSFREGFGMPAAEVF